MPSRAVCNCKFWVMKGLHLSESKRAVVGVIWQHFVATSLFQIMHGSQHCIIVAKKEKLEDIFKPCDNLDAMRI